MSSMVSPCSRMIEPIRPSPGFLRCLPTISNRNSRDSLAEPKTPMPPPDRSNRAGPRARNRSRSDSSTPSRSEISRNGTLKAKSWTMSTTGPLSSIRSSWSLTIFSIIGSSRASRRLVNSGVSSLRSRVWSGGSVKPSPPMPSDGLFGSEPIIGRMSLLKFVESASTALASAWPVTIQTFSPNRLASLCTGSVSRIAPNRDRIQALAPQRHRDLTREDPHLGQVETTLAGGSAQDPAADPSLQVCRNHDSHAPSLNCSPLWLRLQ